MSDVDVLILVLAWVVTALALWYFIPRDKIRDAWVVVLFKQILTCTFGILVVEQNLIEYPVREFSYANRTSFTFEYFVFPGICAFFNLYFPEDKEWLARFMYYILYTTPLTVVEVILEHHTDLIRYIDWEWYWTYLTLLITFYLSRRYYVWFRKSLYKGASYAD